jgi:hypothetical protein
MKTKLKTTKELILNEGFVPDNYGTISYKDLKEEAIKWIKQDMETIKSETKRLRKTNSLTEKGFKEQCNEHLREENARIEWIKHFFNITEKELKNAN